MRRNVRIEPRQRAGCAVAADAAVDPPPPTRPAQCADVGQDLMERAGMGDAITNETNRSRTAQRTGFDWLRFQPTTS